MTDPSDRYAALSTEQPNPASLELDLLTPLEFVDLMQREDLKVLEALERVRADLAECITLLADRFRNGGRLFYAGAGTSGRLGMLDATECPPTFGVPRDLVQAILAGGHECLVRSVEGAEDDGKSGERAVLERGVAPQDFVVGIAASSTTPFVQAVLRRAGSLGAYTVFLSCNEVGPLAFPVGKVVVLPTGPEVLAGSTRLKAGTATKLFLNRLTTGAMIQIGKVYRNRMVDLYLTCDKLRERAIRTTREFTGLPRGEAVELLEKVGGSVKVAIFTHLESLSPEEARHRLESAGGHLRRALQDSSKE